MQDESGVALLIVLLVMSLVAALAMALTLVTSTEGRIATAYGYGIEAFHAADAAAELAARELDALDDWNAALDGSAASTFVDGPPGPRVLPDGSRLDLLEASALINCGEVACSDADLDRPTASRPWGPNNPRWRLFAHGPLVDLSLSGAIDSAAYVVVWVGDDALETDSNPLVDGGGEPGSNPGRGIIQLRAHAYGPFATRRVIEMTLRRTGSTRARVLSWRELLE